jgi:ABC-type multidrug transport system fused ATPase/permease subunit
MPHGLGGGWGGGRGGGGGRFLTGEGPAPIKISDRRMLGWFYQNLAPHWYKVLVGVLAMLGGTAAGLLIPQVLRKIFDDVIVVKNHEPLLSLTLMFLFYTVLTQLLNALRTNVMHLLGQRFVYTVRANCYKHLMGLGLNYFQRERSGDIMSRVSNDVGAVEHMVVHGTDDIISNVMHVVGATAFLFWMDWQMALVALAPLPIYVVALYFFAKRVRPVFTRIRKELGDINAKLQERLGGIQVVKAFAREDPEIEYFDESNRAYWRMSAKSIWMWSTFFPALSMITSLGLVALIWFGAGRAATSAETMSTGTVVAFLMYMQRFYQPISSLAQVQNTINRSLASITRIFELLDEKPAVKDKPGAIELGRVEGRVEVENLSFRYDTGGPVLNDVNVVAQPGQRVAIVGRSGAGKSTLISLVARFYDPVAGRILVDGHDLRDVTQQSLRRNIGMVLQETFLFNASARENILYARPEASMEEVLAAAKGAYAHDFIMKLPEQYESVIGERGVRLSGGEKQRIAIARAFLADPRILVLDEATSMVDTEAEQVIQRALNDLMRGRTTFIIAHRLSTVRQADKILVIEAGRVVEQGAHDELMARNSLYKEMVTRQFYLNEEWNTPETAATT